MEIKRVAPETTEVLKHVDDNGMAGGRAPERIRRVDGRKIRKSGSSDLVFGTVPKSTIGLISLVFLFVIAFIFGIRVLEMSIPVYLIVLVFCTIMGVLLASSPGFVSIIISALLLIVGALTSLFPGVALGTAMLIGASLIIRGE
ncbi:MAG: hypothetical protein IJ075_07470 [Lachnospiraceae bacterium]|nr:hypothetical protein [Lachnospiraceae bacterium]MBQ9606194.1 hypothetical protein [Lachnospiraceae bacterium]